MTGTFVGPALTGFEGDMSAPMALSALISLLLLCTALTFGLAVIEQDTWPAIWRETRRRWLKLLGILVLIAAITMALTFASDLL